MATINTPRSVDAGNKLAYFYPLTENGFGTPIYQKGLVSVSRSVEQSNTPIYADNQVHLLIAGVEAITGEMTFYQFEDDLQSNILGRKKNTNNSFTDTGVLNKFGFSFVQERFTENGQVEYIINCLYACSPLRSGKETTTNTDGVTAEEKMIPFDGQRNENAMDDDGNPASYAEFICPQGTTLNDVKSILETGMLLPTTDLSTILTPATSKGKM